MKSSRWFWIAILLLIVWLTLTWFLGGWIGLKPPALYYLRAGLWIIGLIGFGGYVILRPKEEGDSAMPGASGSGTEIDYNFSEAAKRMQAAKGIRQLGTLPAVFVIGEGGSAKTSIIAKSGLEPELLAGHAYQDYVVAPTRSVNLWFARNTFFIDPAGSVVADAAARKKLFKKFLPVRLNAILAAKAPASRTVVLAVGCETFLQAGGAEALAAKAREFHSVLTELSHELGSSFPVYVVFTKADSIAYFRDFVQNFTDAEASEILGATLPMHTDQREGVYGEQQTRRLTDAFQQLYYSLCDKRPRYLARENDAAKLPNIYEFPREFAKLRPLLVQFLVDLCRPSQLGTSPLLRGFYFTGVRPVTVTDLAPAVQAPAIADEPYDAGATRIFNPRSSGAGFLEPQAREVGARKVPQWVFLGHLFSDVILSDRPATSVTQRNVKINLTRRALLAAAASVALLMAIWWIVSYANNRALISEAVEAARAVLQAPLPPGQLATLDSLRRLTRIRDTLSRIDDYNRHGAPLGYRAFLYSGNSIREPLRVTYYALFRKLLLGPTQETLAAICARPEAYGNQDYRYVYDSLKAYLITTDHHEKSTPEFLTPVLLLRWQQNQQAASEQQNLARQNFDFYAADLANENPYPKYARPDANAVVTGQEYLKKFGQQETIYQVMLTAAGKDLKPIIFNDDYPGSQETVRNRHPVPAAFTKAGYENFQKQAQHPEQYFNGEEWVLGEKVDTRQGDASLKQVLASRYNRDFVKTWQDYLNATSVVGYLSTSDAAVKLGKISSPPFPLLEVLCVASENTKDVPQSFQPVQFVTPPGCSQKPSGQNNSEYMNSLIALKGALDAVGPGGNADPSNVAAAANAATQADNAVSKMALNFTGDPSDPKSPVGTKTTQILREPIARVQPLLKGFGAGAINQAAKGMCDSIAAMLTKYPFNPRSSMDATLQEVTQFLKPQDGQLWQLYNGHLKQLLAPAGNGEYAAISGQQASVTQPFLRFFNHAMHMSEALFRGGAQQPNLAFSMQPVATPDVEHITLAIDGQTLSTDLRSGAKSQSFTWPGTAQGASLSVRFGNGPDFLIAQTTGPWAVWRLLQTSESWQPTGAQYELQWIFKTSAGVQQINGHAPAVKFMLDPQGSQIFRPQYFSSLGCVSKAAQ